jgi:CHAT domain-containing protein
VTDAHHRTPGCPDAETLAAFVEGRLNTAARARIEAHVADCEDCYEAFVETVISDSAVSMSGAAEGADDLRLTRPRRLWVVFSAIAATVLVAGVMGRWWLSPERRITSAVAALAHAGRIDRFSEGRLSLDQQWSRPPSATRGPGVAPERSLAVREAVLAIERASAAVSSSQALHALGLAHVATGQVDAAIREFQDALAVSPPDDAVSIRSDLAAALIDRSLRHAEPADAARALDSASGALHSSASYLPALFNRAAALEILGPRTLAIEAWESYLRADGGSEWANEARTRLATLRTPSADASDIRTIELFHHVEQDSLLTWAGSTELTRVSLAVSLRGDADELHARTPDVELTGLLLAAVESAHWSAPRRACLARALTARAEWHKEYDLVAQDLAFRAAGQEVRALACAGLPTVGAEIGAALVRDRNEAYDPLGDLAREAEARGFLRAAALARISRGNTALRRTDLSAGLTILTDAMTTALKAHDLELASTASAMLADAYQQHGEESRVWRALQQALAWLPAITDKRLFYSVVRAAADAARQERHFAASLPYSGLLANPSAGWSNAGALAYAHLERADALQGLGDLQEAGSELLIAQGLIPGLVDESIRGELENEMLVSRGQLEVLQSPRAAVDTLARPLAYFADHKTTFRLAAVLLARGRAYRGLGEMSDAAADWERAARLIEDQQPAVRDEQLRISRFSALWDVYSELVRSYEADGQQALHVVERARSRELLDSLGRDRSYGEFSPLNGEALWNWLPDRTFALVYCALPDSLLIWGVQRDGVRLHHVAVSQARLETLVGRTLEELQQGRETTARELATLLLGDTQIPAETDHLLIVPDGPLHSVPFAALRVDGSRYLVERVIPVVAPTLSVARAISARVPQLKSAAVLLAAYGAPSADDDLPALPGVDRELSGLRHVYPLARVLMGADATPEAVLREAQKSRLIHIASHAVVNPSYPSESRLLLAGGPSKGSLVPAQISSTRLVAQPVVVLSGCGTAAGRVYRGEGQLSLVRPFLIAGASAVIATLWPLRDSVAPRTTMAIHLGLRLGLGASTALADAQREAIRDGVPLQDWGAFSSFGGS